MRYCHTLTLELPGQEVQQMRKINESVRYPGTFRSIIRRARRSQRQGFKLVISRHSFQLSRRKRENL